LFVAIMLSLYVTSSCAPKKILVYESLPPNETREKVVAFAVDLLGKPYRSGAKGPDSFDCSGLVHYVYKQFNVVLPGSTDGLNKVGSTVAREYVSSGDLVIFNMGKVLHVGIMINRSDFVHASKSRGVAVDSVNLNYWNKRLDHFRRVI
jgi:cell wall-associated NlpC family hydrolase